jgi:hypothetical protein
MSELTEVNIKADGDIYRVRVDDVNHEEKFTDDGLDEAIKILTEFMVDHPWDHFTLIDHSPVWANVDGFAVPARIFTFGVVPDNR